MFLQLLLTGFSVFLFTFLYWRKLKEDYTSDQIFSSIFITLALIGAGWLISQKIFPSWWFWMVALSITLSLLISISLLKMRFYETLEAVFISGLPWLSAIFLLDAIKKVSWFSFGAFAVALLHIALYVYLAKSYKSFPWYRSGRVGFAGLITLGSLFLLRSMVAGLFPFVISFVGVIEIWMSAAIAFGSFLMVFVLSKKIT